MKGITLDRPVLFRVSETSGSVLARSLLRLGASNDAALTVAGNVAAMLTAIKRGILKPLSLIKGG